MRKLYKVTLLLFRFNLFFAVKDIATYAPPTKIIPANVALKFTNTRVKEINTATVKEVKDSRTEFILVTVLDKDVTYDLHRQIEGANLLKCSEFGDAIIKNMDNV